MIKNLRITHSIALAALVIFMILPGKGSGQTPYLMSGGDYSEAFTNIASTSSWPAGLGGTGTDSQEWGPVAVNATGTVGDGIKISTSTATFSTGSSGGVQRGTANIYMLSTGTTNSCAIDLLLNFTGRNAGTISFDVAEVNNSTGDRDSKLKLFYSTNGTTFTEITGTNLPYTARNNVASSASITTIALPSAFNNSATARLRFYEYSTTLGATPTGSQPKISIDNVAVTSTVIVGSTPPTLTADATLNDVDNNIDITFTPDATWEGLISAIKIGGTSLTLTTDYIVSSGNIRLKPSGLNALLTSAGSKSVTVEATGYSIASVTQQINAGADSKLVMKTQPAAPASNGAALATQPAVYIQDQYGNATASTASVTATVDAGTWTLGGTAAVAAVAGTTTFSGLTATSASSVTGATIAFTSGTLTGVTSGTFNIPAPAPAIFVTPVTLSGFTYSFGIGPSIEKTFTVSGLNLTNTIVIDATTDYEISLSTGTGYTTPLTLTPGSGTVPTTTIYVRLKAGLSQGAYNSEVINITSIDATPATITCSGDVTAAIPPLPFYENFSYTTGTDLTANGWNVTGTNATPTIAVSNATISYSGYLSSGIGNEVTMAASGQDVNRSFTAQTTGTIYAAFLVKVTAATTGGDYFFHLGPNIISSTFRGRVFVKRDASSNLYFGISQNNGTVAYTTATYALNTTYLVVLKYTIVAGTNNDVASIYIDPALNAAEPSSGWLANTDTPSDISDIGSVALRQGGSTTGAALLLDGIRVATTWTDIVGAPIPSMTINHISLTGFTYIIGGGPSAEQTFTVEGSNLTNDISIAATTNYEISKTSGTGYTTPLTFTPAEAATPQTIYVRLKAGLSEGSYTSEVINITSSPAEAKTVTCSGSVTAPPPQIDWCNLQWPACQTINLGDAFIPYAQVYEPGVTEAAGAGTGIQAWIGYSNSNTDPSTWTNWVPASFNVQSGNNDEWQANIGTALISSGTYYYASRFQLGTAAYVYGGFNGGFWNGTTNVSGILTVNAAPQLDWANLQSPLSGSITVGANFNVYIQAYEPGVTAISGATPNLLGWVGYSTSNTDPSTWTHWLPASFNSQVGNNDEFVANLGTAIAAPGTYYYASRFKWNLADYVYGGSSGFWNGTGSNSGVLTVNTPPVIINEVDADTPGNDAAEFIELYDGGIGNTSLNGLVVVLYNGSGDISYAAYDLDGYTTDANGYFVIGSTGMGTPIMIAPGGSGWLQNGADAVALYFGDATSFPNGTSVTITNLIDAFVYDTDDPDDAGLLVLLNSGQPQVNEGGKGSSANHSNQRIPNGSGGDRNTVTYDQSYPTPGAANSIAELTWTGDISNEWNVFTNWNPNIVPDKATNTIIPDVTNDPVISASASSRNLLINTSAKIDIASSGSLTVTGTLTNSAGTSGLVVESGGSLIADNGVLATVKQNFTGNVEGTIYHLFCLPITTSIAAHPFFDGAWVNDYVEANGEWTQFTNASTVLPQKGYSINYAAANTPLAFEGAINAGDQVFGGLTHSATGGYGPGWNLVGNPFTSAVDLDLGGTWATTNLDSYIYVWDGSNYHTGPTLKAPDATYTYTTLTNNVIPAMQGFFVHANADGASLTIPEIARVHSSQAFYKNTKAAGQALFLTVEGNGYDDKAIVAFNPDATAGFDGKYDAYKLMGIDEAPQLYSILPGNIATVNSLPSISDNEKVNLGLKVGKAASYTLTVTGLESFDAGIPIRLDDLKTGTSQDLRANATYTFAAAPGDTENRFRLRFYSPFGMDEQSAGRFSIFAAQGQVHIRQATTGKGTAYVYTAAGQLVGKSSLSTGETLIRVSAPGVYFVKVVTDKTIVSGKVVLSNPQQ